nr:PREDICTED: uncharacterized protein LOC107814346 [Nicotiana tabacum]
MVAKDWGYCYNYTKSINGRIWLLWKTHLTVKVLQIHEQFIHFLVEDEATNFQIMLTAVYARNKVQERASLWHELQILGGQIQIPWFISGNFNNVLTTDDRIGQPVTTSEVQDFKQYIDNMQLTPLRTKGCFFTWCNKHHASDRVYSKIDWAFGNISWTQTYGHLEADFLEPGVSDHSPIVIKLWKRRTIYPKPFKLYMLTMDHKDFNPMVNKVWEQQERHDPMALIWLKLKRLKDEAKGLHKTMTSYEKQNMSDLEKWSTIEETILSYVGKANGLMPCPNTSIIKAGNYLTLQHQQELIMDITHEEIDEAIRDMPTDKAPGVDGRMMPAWNCTAITLIPKVPAPSKVKDYRPIACCTALYNVVAKILTRLIKRVIEKFIHWVMECVSTVSYSLVLNGGLTKPFQAKREIRQGDPMSPYLFVIAMEYLQREMNQLPAIKADINSVTKMQETFQRFSAVSSLQANADKSSMYIVGVHQDIKASLLSLTGYTEGSIPFKYLGVPLSAKKLNIHQCLQLVEKITERTYWAQIFILPKKIMKMIETICRTFLWTSSSATTRKALIAWDKVSQPKAAGGLNIINMRLWNKAAILK